MESRDRQGDAIIPADERTQKERRSQAYAARRSEEGCGLAGRGQEAPTETEEARRYEKAVAFLGYSFETEDREVPQYEASGIVGVLRKILRGECLEQGCERGLQVWRHLTGEENR